MRERRGKTRRRRENARKRNKLPLTLSIPLIKKYKERSSEPPSRFS
jgi:hypothetical protein